MGTPVCLNSTLAPSRVLRGDTTQPQQSHFELLALDSSLIEKCIQIEEFILIWQITRLTIKSVVVVLFIIYKLAVTK